MTHPHDVDVIERSALDTPDQRNFTKDWLVQFADGTVWQYDTEMEACAVQRDWRRFVGLDPLSGDPA